LRNTLKALDDAFAINPLMLLPVVLVVYLAGRKTPAVASILAGVFLGILIALVYQRPAIARFVEEPNLDPTVTTLKAIWVVLFDGYSGATGDANLDELLSRGGMSSMLNTVWLILAAMTFGAAMEQAGVLRRLISVLASAARSTGNLITTTLATCLGVNVLAADQYMSIVVTGRMFRDEYRRRGLHEKNLARVLEDGGTITSPLIPWNTCGAYMAATLGVPTLAYLPFCFFNRLRIHGIQDRAAGTRHGKQIGNLAHSMTETGKVAVGYGRAPPWWSITHFRMSEPRTRPTIR
jgi:NhaC family Na+:H+ antiporter